jgi:hypothetical protein
MIFSLSIFVFVLNAADLTVVDSTKVWVGGYATQETCVKVRDMYNKANQGTRPSEQAKLAIYTQAQCKQEVRS